MQHGWNEFYVLLISGAVSLLFPAFLRLISWLINLNEGKKGRAESKPVRPELRQPFRSAINTRFYLAMAVSGLLITLLLVLTPCVIFFGLGSFTSKSEVIQPMSVLLITITYIALAVFYAFKKGDLSWSQAVGEAKAIESEKAT